MARKKRTTSTQPIHAGAVAHAVSSVGGLGVVLPRNKKSNNNDMTSTLTTSAQPQNSINTIRTNTNNNNNNSNNKNVAVPSLLSQAKQKDKSKGGRSSILSVLPFGRRATAVATASKVGQASSHPQPPPPIRKIRVDKNHVVGNDRERISGLTVEDNEQRSKGPPLTEINKNGSNDTAARQELSSLSGSTEAATRPNQGNVTTQEKKKEPPSSHSVSKPPGISPSKPGMNRPSNDPPTRDDVDLETTKASSKKKDAEGKNIRDVAAAVVEYKSASRDPLSSPPPPPPPPPPPSPPNPLSQPVTTATGKATIPFQKVKKALMLLQQQQKDGRENVAGENSPDENNRTQPVVTVGGISVVLSDDMDDNHNNVTKNDATLPTTFSMQNSRSSNKVPASLVVVAGQSPMAQKTYHEQNPTTIVVGVPVMNSSNDSLQMPPPPPPSIPKPVKRKKESAPLISTREPKLVVQSRDLGPALFDPSSSPSPSAALTLSSSESFSIPSVPRPMSDDPPADTLDYLADPPPRHLQPEALSPVARSLIATATSDYDEGDVAPMAAPQKRAVGLEPDLSPRRVPQDAPENSVGDHSNSDIRLSHDSFEYSPRSETTAGNEENDENAHPVTVSGIPVVLPLPSLRSLRTLPGLQEEDEFDLDSQEVPTPPKQQVLGLTRQADGTVGVAETPIHDDTENNKYNNPVDEVSENNDPLGSSSSLLLTRKQSNSQDIETSNYDNVRTSKSESTESSMVSNEEASYNPFASRRILSAANIPLPLSHSGRLSTNSLRNNTSDVIEQRSIDKDEELINPYEHGEPMSNNRITPVQLYQRSKIASGSSNNTASPTKDNAPIKTISLNPSVSSAARIPLPLSQSSTFSNGGMANPNVASNRANENVDIGTNSAISHDSCNEHHEATFQSPPSSQNDSCYGNRVAGSPHGNGYGQNNGYALSVGKNLTMAAQIPLPHSQSNTLASGISKNNTYIEPLSSGVIDSYDEASFNPFAEFRTVSSAVKIPLPSSQSGTVMSYKSSNMYNMMQDGQDFNELSNSQLGHGHLGTSGSRFSLPLKTSSTFSSVRKYSVARSSVRAYNDDESNNPFSSSRDTVTYVAGNLSPKSSSYKGIRLKKSENISIVENHNRISHGTDQFSISSNRSESLYHRANNSTSRDNRLDQTEFMNGNVEMSKKDDDENKERRPAIDSANVPSQISQIGSIVEREGANLKDKRKYAHSTSAVSLRTNPFESSNEDELSEEEDLFEMLINSNVGFSRNLVIEEASSDDESIPVPPLERDSIHVANVNQGRIKKTRKGNRKSRRSKENFSARLLKDSNRTKSSPHESNLEPGLQEKGLSIVNIVENIDSNEMIPSNVHSNIVKVEGIPTKPKDPILKVQGIALPVEIALDVDHYVSDLDQSLRNFPMKQVDIGGSVDVSALDQTRHEYIRDEASITTYESLGGKNDRFASIVVAPILNEQSKSVTVDAYQQCSTALADSITEWSTTQVESHEILEESAIAMSTSTAKCSQTANPCDFPSFGQGVMQQLGISSEYDGRKLLNNSTLDIKFSKRSNAKLSLPDETPRISNEAKKFPDPAGTAAKRNISSIRSKAMSQISEQNQVKLKSKHDESSNLKHSSRTKHFFSDDEFETNFHSAQSTSIDIEVGNDPTLSAMLSIDMAKSDDFDPSIDRYETLDGTPQSKYSSPLNDKKVDSFNDKHRLNLMQRLMAFGQDVIGLSPSSKERIDNGLKSLSPNSKEILEGSIKNAELMNIAKNKLSTKNQSESIEVSLPTSSIVQNLGINYNLSNELQWNNDLNLSAQSLLLLDDILETNAKKGKRINNSSSHIEQSHNIEVQNVQLQMSILDIQISSVASEFTDLAQNQSNELPVNPILNEENDGCKELNHGLSVPCSTNLTIEGYDGKIPILTSESSTMGGVSNVNLGLLFDGSQSDIRQALGRESAKVRSIT